MTHTVQPEQMYTHSAVRLCIAIDSCRLQSILIHLDGLLVGEPHFLLDVVRTVAKGITMAAIMNTL